MEPILLVEALSVGYAKHAIVADINVSLLPGESLLIVGHNGAGKTTLLKTLFGLLPRIEGHIKIFDIDVETAVTGQLIRQGVRYLGQGVRGFGELSVREHRQVLGRVYGSRNDEVMAASTPTASTQSVGTLSIGKRRLEVLNMLSADRPKLYVLDEPTAGLDATNVEGVAEWVRTARATDGASFIIAEHNFTPFIAMCDKALIIRGGEVTYFGASSALLDRTLLSRYFL